MVFGKEAPSSSTKRVYSTGRRKGNKESVPSAAMVIVVRRKHLRLQQRERILREEEKATKIASREHKKDKNQGRDTYTQSAGRQKGKKILYNKSIPMLAIKDGHVDNQFCHKFIHLFHTGYFINGDRRKLMIRKFCCIVYTFED